MLPRTTRATVFSLMVRMRCFEDVLVTGPNLPEPQIGERLISADITVESYYMAGAGCFCVERVAVLAARSASQGRLP